MVQLHGRGDRGEALEQFTHDQRTRLEVVPLLVRLAGPWGDVEHMIAVVVIVIVVCTGLFVHRGREGSKGQALATAVAERTWIHELSDVTRQLAASLEAIRAVASAATDDDLAAPFEYLDPCRHSPRSWHPRAHACARGGAIWLPVQQRPGRFNQPWKDDRRPGVYARRPKRDQMTSGVSRQDATVPTPAGGRGGT